MFIFELLIYVFFAWVMCHLAKKSEELYGEEMALDKYMWGYLLFFSFISAIRWRVGVDSVSYIEIFQEGEIRENSTEYVWDAIVAFIHNWGLHFTIGTGLMAFLQIFFLERSVKEYKYILVWIPVVLYGGRYFVDLMNGVRQMVVACGFVFLSRYIVDKKPIPYLIGILILTGFHHSAILLFPAYLLCFVPYTKISNRRIICFAILIVCFVSGQTPSFQNLIRYVEPLMMSTGYEEYSKYYLEVLMGEVNEGLSLGPIMISFLLCCFALIWFGPALSERYSEKIPYFNLWYMLSFAFGCFYFLVCNMSHMMIRPFQYLEFFQLIMLALLLNYLYEKREENKYLLPGMIFIIWVCTIIGVYKASGLFYETTLYKTFWGHLS